MKKNKWLKWKIGLIGTMGLAFLFHEVKISAEFDKAFTDAAKDTTAESSTMGDNVMQEFNSRVMQQDNVASNEVNQSNQGSNNQRSHTKTGRS